MRIHKYPLAQLPGQVQDVPMPEAAHILSVDEQHKELVLWAVVNEAKPMVAKKFIVYGTGNPVDTALTLHFIGTTMHQNGHLVWHIFEVVEQVSGVVA